MKKKGGPALSAPSDEDEDFPQDGSDIPKTKEMMKMPEDKKPVYVAVETGFTERQARHAKDQVIEVEMSPERAANLLKAGYIKLKEDKKEEPKAEEKAIAGPETDRAMKSEDSEKKGAEGKGADLLKGKDKKDKKKDKKK